MPTACLDTPTGPIRLTEEEDAITRLSWCDRTAPPEASDETPLLQEAMQQLRDYFSGARRSFDLPLRVSGPELQRAVCVRLQNIPYGETMTYGDIGRLLERPARAIGQACGGNPIPIIIPCHRVLATRGLGGFSGQGGIETKVALLRLEGAASLLI